MVYNPGPMARVFISYCHVSPDDTLAQDLDAKLTDAGHDVFIDRRIPIGHKWGSVIDQHLAGADALIALLSAASIESPMVVTEIEAAHVRERANGRPAIMPVRIGDCPPPPYPVSAYVHRFQHRQWQGPPDTVALFQDIQAALAAPPKRAAVGRQRQALIARVRQGIDDHPHGALYDAARIGYSLSLERGRTVRGQDLIVQRADEEPVALAPATRLIEVFDRHHQQLLILGAPGSGKSTLLQELARELMDRAERDEEHPVPVLFNLSSWALERQPLDRWMISELILRLDAPAELAHEWTTKKEILPLLDGLDEVVGEHRDDCLAAINAYRREHGWVPIAVCSRTADYEQLTGRLNVPGAVVVRPLTREQVDAYVRAGGESLAAVRRGLEANPELWELLDTPLMLNTVALAYRDATGAPAPRGPEEVLRRYVDAVFKRRGKETRYPEASIRLWLQWLAATMVRRGQTVFSLEDIVPDWVLGAAGARWVHVVTILLTGALSFAWLAVLQEFWNDVSGSSNLFGWWDFPLFSTPIALGLAWRHGRQARPVESLRLHWPGLGRWLGAVVRGAGSGFLAAWLLSYGACLTLGHASLSDPLRNDDMRGIVIAVALAGATTFSVLSSIRVLVAPVMPATRLSPGALVRRSAVSAGAIWAGSLVATIPAVWYEAHFEAPDGLQPILVGFAWVSWAGLLFAMERGGYFLIQHFAARTILWWRGWGPWAYTRFLDVAAERLLVIRRGGAYTFYHRSLMEHLAGGPRTQPAGD